MAGSCNRTNIMMLKGEAGAVKDSEITMQRRNTCFVFSLSLAGLFDSRWFTTFCLMKPFWIHAVVIGMFFHVSSFPLSDFVTRQCSLKQHKLERIRIFKKTTEQKSRPSLRLRELVWLRHSGEREGWKSDGKSRESRITLIRIQRDS